MPRPRSYSFDHFKVPASQAPERASARPAIKGATHRSRKKDVPASELKSPHYGMEHAETVLLSQQHLGKGRHDPEEERQLVEMLSAPPLAPEARTSKRRGGKSVAREGAAAKRKVSRSTGKKSSVRKSSQKR